MSDVREPRRYLITIGAPSCEAMGLQRLEKVKSDVEEVVRLFRSQGYIHELQSKIKLTTTAPRIKAAISDWFKEPSRHPTDHVVIYYAGHAGKVGRFDDYCLYAIDSDEEEADSLIEIKQLVKSFYLRKDQQHPRNVFFILDACYAGAGGGEILGTLASFNDSNPEGGFWVICAAGSHDQAIDGSFVEALTGILCPTASKLSGDEFISPDTFIGAINNYFESRYDDASTKEDKNRWKQACEGNVVRVNDQARFIRNPHFSPILIVESSPNDDTVARALQTIDFKEQQDKFKKFLKSDRLSDIFFLEVSNDKWGELQKCLVRRLGDLLNLGNIPIFATLKVDGRPWQRETISTLCKKLAPSFHLPETASLDDVLEAIIQGRQTRSIFIVLYDAPLLENRGITMIFNDFWLELQNKLAEEQFRMCQGKVVLLLSGSTSMSVELLPVCQDSNGNEYRNHLKLDMISTSDISEWSEYKQDIINPLCKLYEPNKDFMDLYQASLSKTPAKNAYEIMEIICELLGFKNGLMCFDWKLSGESRR